MRIGDSDRETVTDECCNEWSRPTNSSDEQIGIVRDFLSSPALP